MLIRCYQQGNLDKSFTAGIQPNRFKANFQPPNRNLKPIGLWLTFLYARKPLFTPIFRSPFYCFSFFFWFTDCKLICLRSNRKAKQSCFFSFFFAWSKLYTLNTSNMLFYSRTKSNLCFGSLHVLVVSNAYET